MVIKRDNFFTVVFCFTFFSAFRYFPFLDSEMQPVSGVLSIIFFGFLAIKNRKVELDVLLYFLFCFYLLPFLLLGISIDTFLSLTGYVSYIVSPVLMIFFKIHAQYLKFFHVKLILISFLLISLLQLCTPSSIAIAIEPILNVFINRWSFNNDFFAVRGVSLFYSEPAHAGKFLWLLYVIVEFLKEKLKISRREYILSLATIFLLMLLTRSATAIALCVITYLICFSFNHFNFKRFIFIPFSIVFICFAFYLLYDLEVLKLGRLGQIFSSVNLIYERGFEIEDLQYFGSIRFISVIGGYYSMLVKPLGYGLGIGQLYTIDAINLFGFDIYKISFLSQDGIISFDKLKPFAYVPILLQDVGVFFLVFLFPFVFYVMKVFSLTRSNMMKSVIVVSVFQLFFLSSASLPTPWVALGLVFSLHNMRFK